MKNKYFYFLILFSSIVYSQTNGATNSFSGVFIPTAISNRSPNVRQYTQSLKYCADLEESGYTDWRLPKLEEIQEYITSGGSIPSNGILSWLRGGLKPNNVAYGMVSGFVISIDNNFNGQILSQIESQNSLFNSPSPIGTNFCHCIR